MARTRSTQKEVSGLIREVRVSLGFRNNNDAWNHISRKEGRIQSNLEAHGFGSPILSPYRLGRWTVSAFMPMTSCDGCRWVSMATDFDEWNNNIEKLCERFVSHWLK